MSCMKCGKEVSENQVFCDECLAEMENYPVKPGTAVLLPNRPNQVVTHKRSRRRPQKPEEQISSLKRMIAALCVFCFLLLAALVFSVMVNLQLMESKHIPFLPVQDRNSSETIAPNSGDAQP